MRLVHTCLLLFTLLTTTAIAQNNNVITGTITSTVNNESVSAASVMLKGTTVGTYTDEKGTFKLSFSQSLPVTLVITSVGYSSQEVAVSTTAQPLNIVLTPAYELGQEIVVGASRVPERIMESPVSIERVNTATIRNAPATSYYDILGNLKGVDITTSSFTFKTPSTRGFNSSGNTRLNQIVDGMDNQAPGLNFAVGAIVGPTELDVDNMELLIGASSALYGPGGMNGTILINSKDPFKYQGVSAQVRMGVNHINDYARSASPYYDAAVRWGQKISDKFAFKITAQYIEAKDWVGRDTTNYLRAAGSPGKPVTGNRLSDAAYNGVNVYGDETNANTTPILQAIAAQDPNLQAILQPYLTNPLVVSRTGYKEMDVIDPTTRNFKLGGGLYYMVAPGTQLSFIANYGGGNSVYTGSDRYSLREFKITQYKLEVKSKNWFARAYTTQEDAGKSFNSTVTMQLFNEAWKPSYNPLDPANSWFPQFAGAFAQGAATVWQQAYAAALGAGQDQAAAAATAQATMLANTQAYLNGARAYADNGRPLPNTAQFNTIFNSVLQKPIPQGGLFIDHTALYMAEGQYNLTHLLNKTGDNTGKTEVLVGGNYKRYVLNSKGTLFADTAGKIPINEVGGYLQVSQQLLNDVLKLTASGRYDKNENFKGRFTPRLSAVITVAKDHNIRLSYQTAYRFPTTQQQWINLNVGGGTRLIGGLPTFRDFYHFGTNPIYTQESFMQAFGSTPPNPSLLRQQELGEFKPESCVSYEIGYKGLIEKRFLIDAYFYYAEYKDFLGRLVALQANPTDDDPSGFLSPNIFSIVVNSEGKVKSQGWGISAQYLLPRNFVAGGNIYSDKLQSASTNFITGFNTPKYRANLSFGNTGFLFHNQLGFNLVYRWQDAFYYEGDFVSGNVPAFGTLDAQISYKLPKQKFLFKVGGTNVTNHYYINAYGNPAVGALYYASVGYNVF